MVNGEVILSWSSSEQLTFWVFDWLGVILFEEAEAGALPKAPKIFLTKSTYLCNNSGIQ